MTVITTNMPQFKAELQKIKRRTGTTYVRKSVAKAMKGWKEILKQKVKPHSRTGVLYRSIRYGQDKFQRSPKHILYYLGPRSGKKFQSKERVRKSGKKAGTTYFTKNTDAYYWKWVDQGFDHKGGQRKDGKVTRVRPKRFMRKAFVAGQRTALRDFEKALTVEFKAIK